MSTVEALKEQSHPNLRLAVSGTYSTGKTTTTLALSNLTGIPRTHAKTMREILPDALPGKSLEECKAPELMQLGIRRYAERIVHESKLVNGFISDGSSLHEWVYGMARMSVGINPNDSPIVQGVKGLLMLPLKPTYMQIFNNIGDIVKQHAKESYDEFIHLSVEFPLVADGHRPVSEKFRQLSDSLLKETVEELGIKYHVISGSVHERLEKIMNIYGFEPVMSIDEAIDHAMVEVRKFHLEIEEDAKAEERRYKNSGWVKRLALKLRT